MKTSESIEREPVAPRGGRILAPSASGRPGMPSESEARPTRSATREDGPPVTVEEICDRSALDALAPEWTAFDARTGANFFSTWEWVSTWLDSFHAGRSLGVLFARRGERLVGVLPLVAGTAGSLCRVDLQMPANGQTPCGALAYDGCPASVLGAFFGHVRKTRGRAAVKLPMLPADDPAVAAAEDVASIRRYGLHRSPARDSSRILVQGTWADYLATRSKHVQREWRRKKKRLEEAGKVETRLVTAPADVPAALGEILEIESHSWKHEEGTSFQREAGVAAFYERLALRCAERGWLRLRVLHLDGRPVAHCLAVAYGGELLALKTSFDGQLAHLSPGLTLMLAVAESAFVEGLSAVDLLGDPVRWKCEMANGQRSYVNVCVFPRGMVRCEACLFLRERVAPTLRKNLPPSVVVAGRRWLAPFRSDD